MKISRDANARARIETGSEREIERECEMCGAPKREVSIISNVTALTIYASVLQLLDSRNTSMCVQKEVQNQDMQKIA